MAEAIPQLVDQLGEAHVDGRQRARDRSGGRHDDLIVAARIAVRAGTDKSSVFRLGLSRCRSIARRVSSIWRTWT